MGWADVYVLAGGICQPPPVQTPRQPCIFGFERAESVKSLQPKGMLDSGQSLAVVDISSSIQYRSLHIPGAWWGIRWRLQADASRILPVALFVVTCPDGMLANLAVRDVKTVWPNISVRVVAGGNRSWIKAGLPTAEKMERCISDPDDV